MRIFRSSLACLLLLFSCKPNATSSSTNAAMRAPESQTPNVVAPTPGLGIRLKTLWSGQNVNCGITQSNRVITWGLGNFVESVGLEAHDAVCIDEGSAFLSGELSAHGNADPPTEIVLPFRLRPTRTWVLSPIPDGRAASWTLHLNGAVTSSLGAGLHVPGTFTKIAGGEWGACGIRTDSTMYCERARALEGTFIDVAVGLSHVCGIDKDHNIRCGGSNDHGESSPPSGRFTQVAAGRFHSCAISESNELQCWGAGRKSNHCEAADWQCGQSLVPPIKWSLVRTGAYHTCALDLENRVACWGRNDRGQGEAPLPYQHEESTLRCGLAAAGAKDFSPLVCWTESAKGPINPFSPDVVNITGGRTNSCVLLRDGRVSCMRGGPADERMPRLRVPNIKFANLNADDKRACGTTTDGKNVCFTVENWTQAPIPPGAKTIFTAPLATLGIMPDGHIEVRGHDWVKNAVPAGKFRKLCGGGHWTANGPDILPDSRRGVHACALSEQGSIHCWGDAPAVPTGSFVDIACGEDFVCGLSSGGVLNCMNRKGKVASIEEDPQLKQISSNGRWVLGARMALSENQIGVDGAWFARPGPPMTPPKGEFEIDWPSANVECGRRPSGVTGCWGDGADDLRAPPSIAKLKWKGSE